MATPALTVRADAGPAIGIGHVTRSLALARQWRRAGGAVTFVTASEGMAILSPIEQAGFPVVRVPSAHPNPQDLAILEATASRVPGGWVLVDGYHFDATYLAALHARGHRVLVIDDLANLPFYDVDLIVNPQPSASALKYPSDAGARLLAGPKYALLRDDFQRWTTWRRDVPAFARRVLVTFGGSDRHNQTLRALKTLGPIEGFEIIVVAGGANRHLDALRAAAHDYADRVRLVESPPDVVSLMAWADLAVAAPAGTALELLFMQVPAVLISLSDNQRGGERTLAALDVAECLGWHADVGQDKLRDAVTTLAHDERRRAALTHRGRELVDGRGPERVYEAARAAALQTRA